MAYQLQNILHILKTIFPPKRKPFLTKEGYYIENNARDWKNS